MFEDFAVSMMDTGEAVIRVRHGGSGPALLFLHGHPQTYARWHKIAPRVAEHFTVVAPDLRGYGDSSTPPTTPDHAPYSKQAMARDQVCVMQQPGFECFFVAGQDRGGRGAYRLALDHPDRVLRLAVLDILPTGEHFRRTTSEFSLSYWHWFFLATPFDLPERLIGADPDYFDLKHHGAPPPAFFTPEAFDDYRRWPRRRFTRYAKITARGATFDFALDESDRGKRRITCPLLVLWAGRDAVGKLYDVIPIWQDWADNGPGHAIDFGHYLAEEAPDETYTALSTFFSA